MVLSTVVKLTPPLINRSTIIQNVVCTRPTRQGCFKIPHEQIEGKHVIHCTGHGGAGWTTLFGFVEKAISYVDRASKVLVLGSGCMGLLAAIELKRRGYNVKGIRTAHLHDNASWKAAGYFALIKIEATLEEQQSAYQMGIDTFLTYRAIEKGEHPYLNKKCARFLPVYCTQKMETGLEKLSELGVIPPPKPLTIEFETTSHTDYFEYMTYFMSTSYLMQELLDEARRLRIPIEVNAVRSVEDVKEECILNCTGMGSRELFHDSKMVGVRGHLIMINDLSSSAHTDYMIYTLFEHEGKEENLYMFPKNFFISREFPGGASSTATLGGTFLPDVDQLPLQEQRKTDIQEFRKMLDRHSLFFYGKPFLE